MSPGVDFESRLFAKPNAAALLAKELSAPGYVPKVIAMGTNTDPYQPIERKWRVTRKILEVLRDAGHPVAIVTKSGLVARDIDILSDMARRNLAKVALSVTTLDRTLARVMEPRAATPSLRLATIRKLAEAGIPAAVMVAPIVPAINDSEVERILDAAAAAGAQSAGYVMLRMPLEIKDLFRQWLKENFPDKHDHVISLVRSLHGGKDYDSSWGHRQTGAGPYAWSIGRRFELACKRIGLNNKRVPLTTAHFQAPRMKKDQLDLFAA
jgi:DNA repair photolyase